MCWDICLRTALIPPSTRSSPTETHVVAPRLPLTLPGQPARIAQTAGISPVARPPPPPSTHLVLDRQNVVWMGNLETAYYLYHVHVSMSFLHNPAHPAPGPPPPLSRQPSASLQAPPQY